MLYNNEIYYIKNANSGLYLDVEGNVDADNVNVIQCDLNGGNNQKWRIVHQGNGLYKFYSLCGSGTRVLDVDPGDNTQSANIEIWADNNTSNKYFCIVRNSDGYSYRIVSLCSNMSKVVTVANASCASNARVIQHTYYASHNDEWIFEPVYNYSAALGINYAGVNYNTYAYTYPYCGGIGGDCANFASQCMLAGGVHFQDTWGVYKKNNSYPAPASISQLNYSWSLADPSPWISAKQFNKFWSARVTVETYAVDAILQNPELVYGRPFYLGDVVQILLPDSSGGPGDAFHTMYISGYGTDNGQRTYLYSAHSNPQFNTSLLWCCRYYQGQGKYLRFFTIN